MAHQEPAAEALLARVEPIACRRLSDLPEERLRIAIDERLQGPAVLEPFNEDPCLEPNAMAGHLRDGPHREAADRQDQRNSDDTFVPDGRHLDDGTAAQRRDQ